jgi:hypothetical protein
MTTLEEDRSFQTAFLRTAFGHIKMGRKKDMNMSMLADC